MQICKYYIIQYIILSKSHTQKSTIHFNIEYIPSISFTVEWTCFAVEQPEEELRCLLRFRLHHLKSGRDLRLGIPAWLAAEHTWSRIDFLKERNDESNERVVRRERGPSIEDWLVMVEKRRCPKKKTR